MSKRMFPGLFNSDPTPPEKKSSQTPDALQLQLQSNPFSFDATNIESHTTDATLSKFSLGTPKTDSQTPSFTFDFKTPQIPNPFIFSAGTKPKNETVAQATFKKNGSYAFIIDFPNTQNFEEIEVSIHGETNQGNRYLDILQMKDADGFQLTLARFSLPADANTDHDISAVSQDGLLIVTVKRLEPKVTKVIKFRSCTCGCN